MTVLWASGPAASEKAKKKPQPKSHSFVNALPLTRVNVKVGNEASMSGSRVPSAFERSSPQNRGADDAESHCRRRNTRRSTTDNNGSFFSSGVFSSFVNALPSTRVDVKVGNEASMSGSRVPSALERSSPQSRGADDGESRVQEWTTVERAGRVASCSALMSLLEEEVGKSGVVTAAGYKAVHRQFLYSDTVEREMATQERRHSMLPFVPQTQSGSRLGGLVKSIQRSCSSNELMKNTKYWSGIDGSSRENHNSLTSSSICHAIPSLRSRTQLTCSDHNLAPRRPSICEELNVSIVNTIAEIDEEDFQFLDVDNVDSLVANDALTLSSSKGQETPMQFRIGRKAPVILAEACFDSEDTNVKINSKVDYSCSGDSFSSGSSIADECGWLPWPLEQAKDIDGGLDKEDECGWLPWPVEKDK